MLPHRSASQQTAAAAAASRAAARLQRRLDEEVAARAAVEARLHELEARVVAAARAAAASAVQLTGATETWFAISNVRRSHNRTHSPQPPALVADQHSAAHPRHPPVPPTLAATTPVWAC